MAAAGEEEEEEDDATVFCLSDRVHVAWCSSIVNCILLLRLLHVYRRTITLYRTAHGTRHTAECSNAESVRQSGNCNT